MEGLPLQLHFHITGSLTLTTNHFITHVTLVFAAAGWAYVLDMMICVLVQHLMRVCDLLLDEKIPCRLAWDSEDQQMQWKSVKIKVIRLPASRPDSSSSASSL